MDGWMDASAGMLNASAGPYGFGIGGLMDGWMDGWMDASAGMLSASAGPCGCRMDGLMDGWMPDAVQTLCTYARVRPRWARPLGHLGLPLLILTAL